MIHVIYNESGVAGVRINGTLHSPEALEQIAAENARLCAENARLAAQFSQEQAPTRSPLQAEQRQRIARHMCQGWKLPDSLTCELWRAYLELEGATSAPAPEMQHLPAPPVPSESVWPITPGRRPR